MSWNSTKKIHHLVQLHEESRYYRRFHHTIFSISVAAYIGLIIFQANLLINIAEISTSLNGITVKIMVAVFGVILLIVPFLLTYVFVHWHCVQGRVRDNICALQEELGFPEKYLEDVKYKGFGNKPLIQKLRIGKGHIIFIILLWLVVFANWGISYIFLKGLM